MKQILVTGVGGFVGHHLAAELHSQGISVVGTGIDTELPPELRSVVASYHGNCDLTNADAVANLPLDNVDAVINLAGLAQVGKSFDEAEKYKLINVAVHTTIADRLLEIGRAATRVLAISTGAVYDNHQPMPLVEDSKLASDTSPYALSKIAMEEALQDCVDRGLDIVIVRPFNHIGPGQQGGFLVPDLVSQVMEGNAVAAGDLGTERDYTDVRDVVKAYTLLATKPELNHRLYNVCSGQSLSGQTMLDTIVAAAGKKDISVTVDESKIRPNDPVRVVGDNSRLRTDTGWKPTIPVAQTIKDIVTATS